MFPTLGPDLTDNQTVCTEKALLGALSPDRNDAFGLYRTYFQQHCLLHQKASIFGFNNGRTSEKSDRLARKVLFHQDPLTPPAFFDSSNYGVS